MHRLCAVLWTQTPPTSPLCPLGAAPVWVPPVRGVHRDVRGKRDTKVFLRPRSALGGAAVTMLLRVSKSHLKSPQVSPEATPPVTLLQTCDRYPCPDLTASQQCHPPCNPPSALNCFQCCFHPPGWPLADTVLKTDAGPTGVALSPRSQGSVPSTRVRCTPRQLHTAPHLLSHFRGAAPGRLLPGRGQVMSRGDRSAQESGVRDRTRWKQVPRGYD